MIDIEKYLETGYYFGQINDITDDINEFNLMCDAIMNISLTDETKWNCQYLVSDSYKYPEQLEPHTIPLHKEQERTKFVQENNLYTMSRNYILQPSEDLYDIYNYFIVKVKTFVEQIYDCTVNDDSYTRINCYTDGGKLDPHTDVHNEALCAFVLYLSNDTWNNSGGLCNLTDEGVSCIPIRGNYSIMDLTKHNKRHEVTEVIGNFRRFSYLTFPKRCI